MNLQLVDQKVVIKGRKNIEINYFDIDSVAFHLKSNVITKSLLVVYLLIFLAIFLPIYIPGSVMAIYFAGLIYLLFFRMNKTRFYVVFKWKEKKIKMLMDEKDFEIACDLIDSLRLNDFKKYTTC